MRQAEARAGYLLFRLSSGRNHSSTKNSIHHAHSTCAATSDVFSRHTYSRRGYVLCLKTNLNTCLRTALSLTSLRSSIVLFRLCFCLLRAFPFGAEWLLAGARVLSLPTTTTAGPTGTLLLVAPHDSVTAVAVSLPFEVHWHQVERLLPVITTSYLREQEHLRLVSNAPTGSSNALPSAHIGEPDRIQPGLPSLNSAYHGQPDQASVMLITAVAPVSRAARQFLPDDDNSGLADVWDGPPI